MLQTAWVGWASAVASHGNLPGSWKAAPQSVATGWEQEMIEKLKLGVLRIIVDKDCIGRSAQIESMEVRRMVIKLRGGTAQLCIEIGRWKGEGREERKCEESRAPREGGNSKQRMRMGSDLGCRLQGKR